MGDWIKLDEYPTQFDSCRECGHRNVPLAANRGELVCGLCVAAMALAIDMVPKASYVSLASKHEGALERASVIDQERSRLADELASLRSQLDVAVRDRQRLSVEHASMQRQRDEAREATRQAYARAVEELSEPVGA